MANLPLPSQSSAKRLSRKSVASICAVELLDKLWSEIGVVVHETQRRGPWTSATKVLDCNLGFPFRLEKIPVRAELFGVHKLCINSDRAIVGILGEGDDVGSF